MTIFAAGASMLLLRFVVWALNRRRDLRFDSNMPLYNMPHDRFFV